MKTCLTMVLSSFLMMSSSFANCTMSLSQGANYSQPRDISLSEMKEIAAEAIAKKGYQMIDDTSGNQTMKISYGIYQDNSSRTYVSASAYMVDDNNHQVLGLSGEARRGMFDRSIARNITVKAINNLVKKLPFCN